MKMQWIIYANLRKVEVNCNYFWDKLQSPHSTASEVFTLDNYHWFMGRRRYLLRLLLTTQLEEFRRD